MSDRRSASDLGAGAEAMLSAFPFPERDWESDARAVEARLADGVRGSTDPLLLAPPLPAEADEPSSASATATPLTNSGVRTQSLTELARRSVEKKQASERQMARESLAIAARQRQEQPLSDAPPAPANVSQVAAARPARAVAAVAAPVGPSNHWPKVGVALPVLALAAAALFWFSHPEPTPLVTNTVAPAAPSAVSANASTAAAKPDVVAQDAPRGVDPSTLPGEPTKEADAARPQVLAAPAKAVAGKPTLKGDRAVAAAPGAQTLPPDATLRPADSRGGELPTKPSTGAVQSALGSVMSGARHCVAGDDAPSSAVVVFGSDGRVQHVTVSGAAAGKSSAACIEAQLSRARVQPFAAANFSVNVAIRPE